MNLRAIREIARERGFNPGRLIKVEFIRCIQREEGNFDCYGTALSGYCDQYGCLWREDCLDLKPAENRKPAKKAEKAASVKAEKSDKKKITAKPESPKGKGGKKTKAEKAAKPTKSTAKSRV